MTTALKAGGGGGGKGARAGGGGAASAKPDVPVTERIAEAYRQVAAPGGRARIADIHAALPDVPLASLHAALTRMADRGAASLFRLDDPREIGPRDRTAVFRTPSGNERHIIYMGGRRG